MINYIYKKWQLNKKKKAIEQLMQETRVQHEKFKKMPDGLCKVFSLYSLIKLYKVRLSVIRATPIHGFRKPKGHIVKVNTGKKQQKFEKRC